jgi:5-methylthioadenosine/S-adenosylhomocysteine deaminase
MAETVRDVFVNGEQVVRNREVLTIDQDDALDRLEAGQMRALGCVPEMDWAKRTPDQISAICLPMA